MRLSVIIALYNNVQELQSCVEALTLQGISRNDFEIIIVDDGSTDGSASLADKIAEEWENMYVIHQGNVGLGKARNVGLEAAKGEYIHFIDADDHVMPGAYRFLFDNTLATNPDLVYFDFCTDFYTKDYIPSGRIAYIGSIHNYTRDHHVRPNSWLKLYRKGHLSRYNLQFPPLRTRQDIAFTWDMMRYDGSMVVTEAKLYSYTINPNGATYNRGAQHVKRTVYDLVTLNEMLKEFSRDYSGIRDFFFVCNHNYHVLFNRILCSHFSFREIRDLFSRCSQIGTSHIPSGRFFYAINFLYHHPLFYFLFQYLVLWCYKRRFPVPAGDRGDLINHRLKEK